MIGVYHKLVCVVSSPVPILLLAIPCCQHNHFFLWVWVSLKRMLWGTSTETRCPGVGARWLPPPPQRCPPLLWMIDLDLGFGASWAMVKSCFRVVKAWSAWWFHISVFDPPLKTDGIAIALKFQMKYQYKCTNPTSLCRSWLLWGVGYSATA